MQAPGRTSLPDGKTGGGVAYTDAQVLAALAAGGRQQWVFDRLDPGLRYIGDLTPFVDTQALNSVTHDTSAAVKRTMALTLRSDAPLSPLTEYVRIHYQLGAADGGWLDFTLGTFLPNAPTKKVLKGVVWYDFVGSDLSQLLADTPFEVSTAVAVGSGYQVGIRQLLAGTAAAAEITLLMTDTGLLLPASLGWSIDDSRVAAINSLAKAIAYTDLWFDEVGRARTDPIPDYAAVALGYTFDTTVGHAPVSEWSEKPDLTRAANVVVVISEDPRRAPIIATYENSNPESEVSTVRWHRKVRVIRDSTIADSASAIARAKAEAQLAAFVYTELDVPSLPWPLSQDHDVYGLVYATDEGGTARVVSGRYLEVGWTHACTGGFSSTHRLTRVTAV